MRYREALAEGTAALEKAGIETARLDAWYLLEHVCHITRQYFYLNDTYELKEEEQQEYELAIGKRAERVPLQYIIGEQEFMGLTFKVNPSVLIPRQDTEILVEEILKICKPDARVLDLCTGSGCIIISMVRNLPNIEAYGGDISRQAINAAKENAKLNGLDNCRFIAGDVLKVLDDLTEKPDVIVLDPPRDGIHPKALPKILSYGVNRIVYVSCKATSLARDLEAFLAAGYRLEKACCVDQFCETVWTEAVALLVKE